MAGLDSIPVLSFLAPPASKANVSDDPPERPDSDDVGSTLPPLESDGLNACLECGNPVPWSGRGRKPLRHDECKTRKTSGPRAPKPPPVPEGLTNDQLGEELMESFGELSGAVAFMAPVTSTVIGHRAEKTTVALLKIGDRHPAFRRGLETAMMFRPYTDVGYTLGAVIYAAGVDAGRFPADNLVAERLGVADAAREIGFGEDSDDPIDYQPANLSNGMLAPPPPAFRWKGD